jgi:DNA replication protein DnaD
VCPLNYIAEINAFYNWLPFNLLPADAQALWHALMNLNNKCAVKADGEWTWRVEFTVSNTTLLSILKFSRQQLDRMRNVLIQTGRIEYRKGKGNQCGTYKVIPFDANYVTQTVTQVVTQSDTQTDTQTGYKCCTLINNNINNNSNYLNDDDDDARAGVEEETEDGEKRKTPEQLFALYFGKPPTAAEVSQCNLWLESRDYDLVEFAFHQACATDNKNIAYAGGVLKKLRNRNVKDMGDLAEDHLNWEQQRRR